MAFWDDVGVCVEAAGLIFTFFFSVFLLFFRFLGAIDYSVHYL